MIHTRRSSRLPNVGAELLDDDSCFLDSDGLGLGVSFGSAFFSGGGEELDCSLGFGSSFDGSGSDDVDWSFDAGSLGSEEAFSLLPPSGAPPISRRTKS